MKFSAAGGWFEGSAEERINAAAKAGFRGIEMLSWLGLDFRSVKYELDKTGLTSTALIIQSESKENSALMRWEHGMVHADSRDAFVESFRETVKAAHAMAVPNIIATVGNARADASRDEQRENIVKTLSLLAPIAEEENIMIILEPLNDIRDHIGHFLVKSADGFSIIDEVASPALTLLFDIYHQQVSEGNVTVNSCDNIAKIGHFHIADVPGRKQPGTGEINYKNVFRDIMATGYDKWLAFECGNTLSLDALVRDMHGLIDEFDS